MGIGPLLGDQATMPAQDRARCDQAMPPQHLRQPADEGGEDRAIRPIQARLRIDSAQHGNFVAQHQQLDVLGHRRATKQHQQIQQPDEDKVEQTQRHGARSCLLAKPANLPGQQRGPTSGTPQVYKWARFSHPNKSVRWVLTRYFGMFHPARQDKWVFGSRDSGFYLRKFAWTPIIRHRMVAGTASPDDSSLTDYWAQRRRRNQPPIGTTTLRLLRIQHGRCPLCQGLLLHADREPQSPREWEQWLTATRTAIRKHAITIRAADTPDERIADRLIHAHCRHRITDTNGKPTTPAHREPTELA
jgi:hypothetical protein